MADLIVPATGTAPNPFTPDVPATPAAAGVNSGPASTLLTGSGGIPNSALNLGGTGLGGNSLLGQ